MTLRLRNASGRLTASRTGIAINSMLAAMAMGGCEQVPYSGVCPCATGYRCCNDRCIPSSQQCQARNTDPSFQGPYDADPLLRSDSPAGSGGAQNSTDTSGSGGAITSVGGSAAEGTIGTGGSQDSGGVVGTGGNQDSGGVVATDAGVDPGWQPIDGAPDAPTQVETAPALRLGLVAGSIGGRGILDGVGTAARFTRPVGAAWGGSDSLFVVDSDEDRERQTIRRVDVNTGAVSTFAGSPGHAGIGSADGVGEAAQFRGLSGIASDGVATLFVSDRLDQAIRKIDIATRRVSTLTRVPTSAVDADGSDPVFLAGIAWDPAGRLYVAGRGDGTIREVDVATGMLTILAGESGVQGTLDGVGEQARFGCPTGVALDGGGALFVTDQCSCTIRKIDLATRHVDTFAGSPGSCATMDGVGSQARLDSPGAIESDGAGYLYLGSRGLIRKVHIATATVTTSVGSPGTTGASDGIGSEARLGDPSDLAFDGKGHLYVADSSNTNLRKIGLS